MFKTGDIVNYHSIIGGAITSEGHEITFIDRQPNNFGCDVAWITGKSGCVAIAALSNDAQPMQLPEKPLSRSQKRYKEYIDSEYSGTYAEYIGVYTECHVSREGYSYRNYHRSIFGPNRPTKKEAKAVYKDLLNQHRGTN